MDENEKNKKTKKGKKREVIKVLVKPKDMDPKVIAEKKRIQEEKEKAIAEQFALLSSRLDHIEAKESKKEEPTKEMAETQPVKPEIKPVDIIAADAAVQMGKFRKRLRRRPELEDGISIEDRIHRTVFKRPPAHDIAPAVASPEECVDFLSVPIRKKFI